MRETLLKTLKEVAASVIDPGVKPTAKPTFGRGDAPTCCHRLRRGDAAHEVHEAEIKAPISEAIGSLETARTARACSANGPSRRATMTGLR
jgi:hypothetical protein